MERIEHYEDFRAYLRDFYEDRKKRSPYFSYRTFARKAGLTSPSHFKEVVDGTRKLTAKTIGKFIKGLGLTDHDARYFTALVHFNQSRSPQEKQHFLEQMRGLKQKVRQYRVPLDHFELYSRWYHVAIRELACLVDWGDDYGRLASMLEPPIKKSEARAGVEFLVNAGFLRRCTGGRYEQCNPAITSGSEVCSAGVRAYNKYMAGRARDAIEQFPPSERDMQSMTVGISREAYAQIKQEMQEFFARVARIVDDDKGSDRVYNMNVHLFPLSSPPAEADHE